MLEDTIHHSNAAVQSLDPPSLSEADWGNAQTVLRQTTTTGSVEAARVPVGLNNSDYYSPKMDDTIKKDYSNVNKLVILAGTHFQEHPINTS